MIGAAVVVAAILGLLWKRVRWDTRFGLLTAGLLGLVAGAAWAPEGLVHGLAALRQPTAAVLAGASALGLLAAGAAALRWSFLHLGVRALVALLAAYGMSGFVLAILRGTAFTGLFHGGSFLEKLPFFLQGAVLGAVGVLPPVQTLEEADLDRGFNLAREVLGGRIAGAHSEYDENWGAQRLIDGGVLRTPIGSNLRRDSSPGWSSKAEKPPFELVFGFLEDREALIRSVILDPTTSETRSKPQNIPRLVEVWVSPTGRDEDFAKVSEGRIRRVTAEQVIAFEPTRARRVKLRILSNHGGDYTQLGEVKVLEDASQGRSILDDVERNLALPWLGGAVARMSSQSEHAAYLIDGVETEGGWRSQDGYLPQELVFAFARDREAFVESVALVPYEGVGPEYWPTTFTLAVSSENPLDGFVEIGSFELAPRPQPQVYPVGRLARFVKLRILGNGGGSRTMLREVKILEGPIAQHDSILFEPPREEADWRRRRRGARRARCGSRVRAQRRSRERKPPQLRALHARHDRSTGGERLLHSRNPRRVPGAHPRSPRTPLHPHLAGPAGSDRDGAQAIRSRRAPRRRAQLLLARRPRTPSAARDRAPRLDGPDLGHERQHEREQ